MDETRHLVLPAGDHGDVIIRAIGGGIIALEGWVGSCDGHRHALDCARQETGACLVDDRVAIVLGRRSHAQRIS